MYEKTCPVCGIIFTTDNAQRKYCDDCRNHSSHKIKQMNVNIIQSKIRCGDYEKPVHTYCKQCNKPITIPPHVPAFCTPACRTQYAMENRTCTYCGKKLYPAIKITRESGAAFHPECKEPYYERKARQNGRYKICPVCTKEFRIKATDQIYCGKECKRIANADLERYGKECKCLVCGKIVKIPHNSMKKPLHPGKCATAFNQIQFSQRTKQTPIQPKSRIEEPVKEPKETKTEKAKRQREEENQKNGLCGYCKTSYKKCPYISSGFKTKPDGAIYKDSKIVKCPIFTDSRPPIK